MAESSTCTRANGATNTCRVLVSDDKPKYCQSVKRAIGSVFRAEFELVHTLKDTVALATQEQESFYLFVLDRKLTPDATSMPEVDALALELASRGKRVIMLTAFPPDDLTTQRLHDAGVMIIKKGAHWHRRFQSGVRRLWNQGPSGSRTRLKTEDSSIQVTIAERPTKASFLEFLHTLPRTKEPCLLWAGRELTIAQVIREVRKGTNLGKELFEEYASTFEEDQNNETEHI